MQISGIYQIQSISHPERIYIGSSTNIKQRKVYHLRDLRGNKHTNKKLQNHYNKYGESDLVFSVIVGCDDMSLLEQEQFFLDSMNPYFNLNKVAHSIAMINVGRKHTKEHNEKIAKAQMGENNSMYGVEPWNKGTKGVQKNPNKGKKGIYSEETLAKMSVSNKRAWEIRKQKQKENAG